MKTKILKSKQRGLQTISTYVVKLIFVRRLNRFILFNYLLLSYIGFYLIAFRDIAYYLPSIRCYSFSIQGASEH